VTPPREDPRALIRYALAGALFTVVIAWALYLARDAVLLVYLSAVVAIGLGPVVTTIEKTALFGGRLRLKRWQGILLLYVLLLGLIVGIGMLVVPPLVTQGQELWRNVPEYLHRGQQYLIRIGLLNRELTVREAVEQTPVAGTDALGTVFGAVAGFFGGIFGFVTIMILAFYFLLDAGHIVRAFVRLFPHDERARVAEACARITGKVSAWLAGQLLLGAIIGGTAAIALFLMGVPYFYVLALISGVGELIPIIGPIVAAVPAVLVALTVSPTLALGVAAFFFAQQQLENHILVPRIMSRQVGVSPVIVIVSLLVGGSLLGILGAIIAVPSAAILQVIFEEWKGDGSP
jgi:predicted PurR-regulated permease PerM